MSGARPARLCSRVELADFSQSWAVCFEQTSGSSERETMNRIAKVVANRVKSGLDSSFCVRKIQAARKPVIVRSLLLIATEGAMKTVNAYYLHHALGPLNAITDSEYEATVADWNESAPQGIRSSSLATSSRATTAGMSSRRGMCSTRYSTAWRPAGSISLPFWRTSGTRPCHALTTRGKCLKPSGRYSPRGDHTAQTTSRPGRSGTFVRKRSSGSDARIRGRVARPDVVRRACGASQKSPLHKAQSQVKEAFSLLPQTGRGNMQRALCNP